jgi:hypothetical protein
MVDPFKIVSLMGFSKNAFGYWIKVIGSKLFAKQRNK